MGNQPAHKNSSKQPACSCHSGFESLIAPKYLASIDTIISERLVSSLRPASTFTVNRGFVVSSHSEAADAVERFVSFGNKLPGKQKISSLLDELRNSSLCCLSIQFPESLISTCPLPRYYGGCTISPFGSSQLAVQFGDGVIPDDLHAYMELPAITVAQQFKFILEPIPNTRGAKAFSINAATSVLANLLGSNPQITIKSVPPRLEVIYQNEPFVVSFDLFCYRTGSDYYIEDLVIFPCPGTEVPWNFRERLVLTVTPNPIPYYETTDEMLSRHAQLSSVASIITSGLQELFGLHSHTRLKSVARETGRHAGDSQNVSTTESSAESLPQQPH